MNTSTKSVIYARVSSKEQEETGYSLDAQEKLLKDYAMDNDYAVKKVFRITESASGKQIRNTFNEMLQYAEKYKIPVILCEKIDRLTRNIKDAAIVSDWISEDSIRQVHFVKENFILSKNTRAHENLVWDMKVAIARFYTNNLSEEVKKGQKEKIAQGWLPTKPPLGYKTIGEKGHKIHIIDEDKAPLVRKMFELYATGNYSIKALVNKMYEEGLRTRGGNKLGKARMHEFLTDPFYCGKIRWNGEISKGEHEPIISKGLFEEVQQKLTRKIANPYYKKHLPVFKAKMKCESCGATITWEIQKGNWYGHHSSYEKYKDCPNVKNPYIRQEKVEEQLFPHFEKAAPKNERVLKVLEKALKESHSDKIKYHDSQRKELNTQYERAQRRLEAIYEDKIDGKITPVFYEKKFKEYTQESEDVLEKLNKLNDTNKQYYEAGYAIHELALNAVAIYKSKKATTEERRMLLSHAFSNLSLDGEQMKPNYSLAFEFLIEWMPRVNKIFEPTQKAPKRDSLRGTMALTTAIQPKESLQPRNNFRTYRNPHHFVRFSTSDAKSGELLRERDKIRTIIEKMVRELRDYFLYSDDTDVYIPDLKKL